MAEGVKQPFQTGYFKAYGIKCFRQTLVNFFGDNLLQKFGVWEKNLWGKALL